MTELPNGARVLVHSIRSDHSRALKRRAGCVGTVVKQPPENGRREYLVQFEGAFGALWVNRKWLRRVDLLDADTQMTSKPIARGEHDASIATGNDPGPGPADLGDASAGPRA